MMICRNLGHPPSGCRRYGVRLLVLALSCAAVTKGVETQAASGLDSPMPDGFHIYDPTTIGPCRLGELIDQIARKAEVPVGIEVAPECHGFARSVVVDDSQAIVLSAQSARQAFDQLMEFAPEYLCLELDGVAVFRPVEAWADRQSVLRTPVAAFEVKDARLHNVVQTILKRATPPLLDTDWVHVPQPINAIDAPFSMSFTGGTLLEALNSTLRAGPGLVWHLTYAVDEGEARLGVSARTLPGGSVTGMMRLPQRSSDR